MLEQIEQKARSKALGGPPRYSTISFVLGWYGGGAVVAPFFCS